MNRRDLLKLGLGGLALAACRPVLPLAPAPRHKDTGPMARGQQGVVTAIDRANGVVQAVLTDGTPITAAYLRSRQPWPLATATFLNDGGSWLCTGPVGDRRVVLNDDFTNVATVVATAAGAAVQCDTAWTAQSLTPASSVRQNTAALVDYQGAVEQRYIANAAGTNVSLRKDINSVYISPSTSLHLAARVTASNYGSNNFTYRVGFGDFFGGADNGSCDMLLQNSIATVGVTDGLGGTNTQVSGVALAVNTWNWVDLVLGPLTSVAPFFATFAAGWVDGDGPYALMPDGVGTGFPFAAFTPFFDVADAVKGTNITGYLDTITVAAVSPANDPSLYRVN